MNKVKKGPQTWLYPMPILLIGATVKGKPNFMAAAWANIANSEPPMVSVAIRRTRYTHGGLNVGDGFSVNVPSTSQAREVDFCGIESGSRMDKVERCGFTIFYGENKSAPLIQECPLNLECVVEQLVELGTHSLVIAHIKETHISESCMTGDDLDMSKMDPLIYLTSPARQYAQVGAIVAEAFKVGLKLK
ncbi:MAG: flavin reductase family protein [Dehalococcoidia bacterium]|nr:flavin reductase family protein [Dehalococcoidia bacterium]